MWELEIVVDESERATQRARPRKADGPAGSMGRWPGEGETDLCSQSYSLRAQNRGALGKPRVALSWVCLRKDKERQPRTSSFVLRCPRALEKQDSKSVPLFTTALPCALALTPGLLGTATQQAPSTCPWVRRALAAPGFAALWAKALRPLGEAIRECHLRAALGRDCPCPLQRECCPERCPPPVPDLPMGRHRRSFSQASVPGKEVPLPGSCLGPHGPVDVMTDQVPLIVRPSNWHAIITMLGIDC